MRHHHAIVGLVALSLLLLLQSPSLATQRVDARLNIPLTSFRYWYTGDVQLAADRQPLLQLDLHTIQLRAMIGHRFAGGSALMFALRYDATFASYRQPPADAWQRVVYHAPFARAAAMLPLRGRWGLTGYAMVGVASDMQDVVGSDIRVTVGGGATYIISRDLRFVFGAMYTTAFFIPLPLPLLNIYYRTGPWRLSLMIPKGASVWRELGRHVELGVVFGVLNLRYGLHDVERYGDSLSALNVTAGPAARLYLFRGLFVQGNGGYNVRHFRVQRDDEAIYDQLTFGGAFASASLGYML